MYPKYEFIFVLIIVGAMRNVPKDFCGCVKKLGFNDSEAFEIVRVYYRKVF